MVACRYGISLLVFNSTSHSFAVPTRELSISTLEEKFHIYARPCIILHLLTCCKLVCLVGVFCLNHRVYTTLEDNITITDSGETPRTNHQVSLSIIIGWMISN